MVYVIKVKPKKGVTRGGFARTVGNRVFVFKTKKAAQASKARFIKKKSKVPQRRNILRKLITVKKI